MKQLKLFNDEAPKEFGGSLAAGKRKNLRPLDTRNPIHLVLKAKDSDALLENKERIIALLKKYAEKFGLKIYGIGVSADHIHFSLLIQSRPAYNRWVRTVTGRLAIEVKGLKWRFIPFTRVGSWGRDFKKLQAYIQRNDGEGEFILGAHQEVARFEKDIYRQVNAAMGIYATGL